MHANLERERARLQALQQEQLEHTEVVLQQQRHYLEEQRAADIAEGCGSACGSDTAAESRGSTRTKKVQPAPSEASGDVFIGSGFFSPSA